MDPTDPRTGTRSEAEGRMEVALHPSFQFMFARGSFFLRMFLRGPFREIKKKRGKPRGVFHFGRWMICAWLNTCSKIHPKRRLGHSSPFDRRGYSLPRGFAELKFWRWLIWADLVKLLPPTHAFTKRIRTSVRVSPPKM